jgi:hypothetical protein
VKTVPQKFTNSLIRGFVEPMGFFGSHLLRINANYCRTVSKRQRCLEHPICRSEGLPLLDASRWPDLATLGEVK